MRSSVRCPLDASRRRPEAVILPSGKASAAATSSRKGSSSPTSCRDSKTRESRMAQLPRQHNAADFDRPAPVALADVMFVFNDRPIAVQLEHGAAVDKPKQTCSDRCGRMAVLDRSRTNRAAPNREDSARGPQPLSRNRPQSSMNCSHRLGGVSQGGFAGSSRASASAQVRVIPPSYSMMAARSSKRTCPPSADQPSSARRSSTTMLAL